MPAKKITNAAPVSARAAFMFFGVKVSSVILAAFGGGG
jgi:hypothetical protein